MSEINETELMEGRIKIDNEYSLKSDSRCWILLYYRKKKKKDGSGETYDYDPTYHGTVAAALRYYLEQKMKEASGDVKNITVQIDAAMNKIEEMCKNSPSVFGKPLEN